MTNYCDFRSNGNGKLKCWRCGATVPNVDMRVFRKCNGEKTNPPPIASQIVEVASAVSAWIAAGRPIRTDEQVQRIFDLGCSGCPHLSASGKCKQCGCPVRSPPQEVGLRVAVLGKALSNKIRMATEDCPDRCRDCGHSRWRHLGGKCECGCGGFNGRKDPLAGPLTEILTICVTTFRREKSLERCLQSISARYPGVVVDVENTEGNLSAGRNRLVARCRTPLFALIEDDMEFTAETDLEKLAEIVRSDDELIGCSGHVAEGSKRPAWRHDWQEFRGELLCIPPTRPVRISPSGVPYQPCQLTHNFGVFRTDTVRRFPWDEELPVAEHQNWFYSWRKDWLVGFAESVSIDHHRDRQDREYNRYRERARDLVGLAAKKLGFKSLAKTKQIQPPPERPCIVLLGVGHSNTSITAKQIAALGWNLGDADEEYCESRSVREINRRITIDGETVPLGQFISTLAALPKPWIVKDPRFTRTLGNWLPAMAEYEPLLVWISKDIETVQESFEKRGERADLIGKYFAAARKHFELWPWAKIKIDAESIGEAVAMFDLGRLCRSD